MSPRASLASSFTSIWFFWLALLSAVPSAQAFLTPQPYHAPTPRQLQSTLFASSSSDDAATPLTHSDIEWKLRPSEESSKLDRLKYKLGSNILRLNSKLKGQELPPVLCPRGGRALLEAYYKEPGQRKKKVARFGFTASRGPSAPPIDQTIQDIYNINPNGSATIAAIIYMFVEPEYRSRDVGVLALEVISAIQSVQAVDFTVLVADDNGSGGLVRWYEEHGYSKAPFMQNILGSPEGVNGVSMIAPVKIEPGFFDQCKIKWW